MKLLTLFAAALVATPASFAVPKPAQATSHDDVHCHEVTDVEGVDILCELVSELKAECKLVDYDFCQDLDKAEIKLPKARFFVGNDQTGAPGGEERNRSDSADDRGHEKAGR